MGSIIQKPNQDQKIQVQVIEIVDEQNDENKAKQENLIHKNLSSQYSKANKFTRSKILQSKQHKKAHNVLECNLKRDNSSSSISTPSQICEQKLRYQINYEELINKSKETKIQLKKALNSLKKNNLLNTLQFKKLNKRNQIQDEMPSNQTINLIDLKRKVNSKSSIINIENRLNKIQSDYQGKVKDKLKNNNDEKIKVNQIQNSKNNTIKVTSIGQLTSLNKIEQNDPHLLSLMQKYAQNYDISQHKRKKIFSNYQTNTFHNEKIASKKMIALRNSNQIKRQKMSELNKKSYENNLKLKINVNMSRDRNNSIRIKRCKTNATNNQYYKENQYEGKLQDVENNAKIIEQITSENVENSENNIQGQNVNKFIEVQNADLAINNFNQDQLISLTDDIVVSLNVKNNKRNNDQIHLKQNKSTKGIVKSKQKFNIKTQSSQVNNKNKLSVKKLKLNQDLNPKIKAFNEQDCKQNKDIYKSRHRKQLNQLCDHQIIML